MDVLAVVVGTIVVVWVLASAIRTVVIPRPERSTLGWGIFAAMRWTAHFVANRFSSESHRERILGAFPSVTLVGYPAIWSVGVVLGFALIFSGLDIDPFSSALVLSASSLTTLGFAAADTDGLLLIAAIEALIGLGLVALMISFLPTIYGVFSHREVTAGSLTIRAGEPPQAIEFLIRTHQIGTLEQIDEGWLAWEEWFVELGETHTTFPQLVFFRSHRPGRTWLGAAEVALDTAALITSCKLAPSTGHAQTTIRAGFLALNNIADFLRIPHDPDPGPQTSISVERDQFETLLDRLEQAGIDVPVDRDTAWTAYRGWRCNYDEALVGLHRRYGNIDSHWDRLG